MWCMPRPPSRMGLCLWAAGTAISTPDAATGKEKWRFKTGEDPKIHNQVGIQSSAAVADGTVYFGCRDSNFYAVR